MNTLDFIGRMLYTYPVEIREKENVMLCTRCGKRPAVVFVSNNNSKDAPTVGYCLTCAKELGIKPVEDLISKMGISDEDLENVQDQMNTLMQGGDLSQLMEQLGADNLAEQMDQFASGVLQQHLRRRQQSRGRR